MATQNKNGNYYAHFKSRQYAGMSSRSEKSLVKKIQRCIDCTSFKNSKHDYVISQLIGDRFKHIKDISLISNGLTVKEWKSLGYPTVDGVKKIIRGA